VQNVPVAQAPACQALDQLRGRLSADVAGAVTAGSYIARMQKDCDAARLEVIASDLPIALPPLEAR
jgi:hypothetical protein